MGVVAEKTEKKFSGMATKLQGLLAGIAASYALKTMISNTVESEQAFLRLETVIKSTGGTAGKTASDLAKMSSQLQNITTFGDEAIQRMQAILLTFRNIKGDQFDEATMAVLNLSAALGMDLQTTALQLGKALNDPILGLTALRRVGIQFEDSQEALIKKFVETNDLASAQKVMLKELEVQFGGTAVALRGSLGGALSAFKNALGDLFEMNKVDGFSNLRNEVERFTAVLQTEEVRKFADALGGVVIESVSTLAEGFAKLSDNADEFLTVMKALATYKISGKVLTMLGLSGPAAGGVALGLGLYSLVESLDDAKLSTAELSSGIAKLEKDVARLENSNSPNADTLLEQKKKELEFFKLQLMTLEEFERRGTHTKGIGGSITKPGKTLQVPGVSDKNMVPEGDALKASLEKMRDEIKYLNADGTSFLTVLDQWKAKLEPLSEPWKKVVDLQKEILTMTGQISTATPLDRIGQAIQYLNIDGEKFLPILDKWKAKLTPLSDEWMRIVDLQSQIKDVANLKGPKVDATEKMLSEGIKNKYGETEGHEWQTSTVREDTNTKLVQITNGIQYLFDTIDKATGKSIGGATDKLGLNKQDQSKVLEDQMMASLEKIANAGGTTGENTGKAIADGITKYVEEAVTKAQGKLNSLKFNGFGSITEDKTGKKVTVDSAARLINIAGRGQ